MDSDNLIPLRVMGLSYNQLQNGAYALLLAQTDGPYRIPVVIGAPEAQSIAIALEGIISRTSGGACQRVEKVFSPR